MNRFFEWLSGSVNLLWWLCAPLMWWIKVRVSPENPKLDLKLKPNDPVVYVLHHRSISDYLVLYHHCRRHGLPSPKYLATRMKPGKQGGFFFMAKLGFFQVKREDGPPTPLQKLCVKLQTETSRNIQLVPVSVMWGRNPGSEERSMFKLMFPDDEHAGIIQKILIILAQGRQTILHFGQPISMRDQIDMGPNAVEVSKKLRRVLRVHFRRQRTIALGPKNYDRNRMISLVFNSKSVRGAIQSEIKKGVSKSDAEQKARKYIKEIAAHQSHSTIKLYDVVLSYIWNKIYSGIVVHNGESVRKANEKRTMVYVPAHRSHLDYLIMPYELNSMGLKPPHVAAGVNLSFWPLGGVFRRGGAFFIRRSFRGNKLYAVVFTEYLTALMQKGFPVCYFPEGGRSRSGRLLQPKTGMLAMIVMSYLKDPQRPIGLVPVYIGYDKVAEVSTYLGELRGAKKEKESFAKLLALPKILRSNFGQAYVGFADSLDLEVYLKKYCPKWREESYESGVKPPWLHGLVEELANDLMKGINSAAVVSPVSLVALCLLSSPQRAMAVEELLKMLEIVVAMIKNSSLAQHAHLTQEDPETILSQAEKIASINRFEYPAGGDVIFLNELDGVMLSYYRNNILHLMALPSLVACYFQHNDEMTRESLIESCVDVYPFLAAEFFLKWTKENVADEINQVVDNLIAKNILVSSSDGAVLSRPNVAEKEFGLLTALGRCLGIVFERYGISTAMLSTFVGTDSISRTEFESKCQMLAQRISILSGVSDPEFYDKSLFKRFVDMLRSEDYLHDVSDGKLRVDARLEGLSQKTASLISPDISKNIKRLTKVSDA